MTPHPVAQRSSRRRHSRLPRYVAGRSLKAHSGMHRSRAPSVPLEREQPIGFSGKTYSDAERAVALPDHDHPYRLAVHVRMRHRRALDEQLVVGESDVPDLLPADPRFVPGDIDLGGDGATVDPIAAGIADHGAERLRPLLV